MTDTTEAARNIQQLLDLAVIAEPFLDGNDSPVFGSVYLDYKYDHRQRSEDPADTAIDWHWKLECATAHGAAIMHYPELVSMLDRVTDYLRGQLVYQLEDDERVPRQVRSTSRAVASEFGRSRRLRSADIVRLQDLASELEKRWSGYAKPGPKALFQATYEYEVPDNDAANRRIWHWWLYVQLPGGREYEVYPVTLGQGLEQLLEVIRQAG